MFFRQLKTYERLKKLKTQWINIVIMDEAIDRSVVLDVFVTIEKKEEKGGHENDPTNAHRALALKIRFFLY